MTRPDKLRRDYSGLALGREEAIADPFALISRPLYVPPPGAAPVACSPSELIRDPSRHPQSAEFEQLIRRARAFVLGGTNYICEMGLLPTWYKDDATRKETIAKIGSRLWNERLLPIAHNDGADTVFRKTEIPNYFNTLPPLKREAPAKYQRVELAPVERWHGHRLRLRKVVELIALTEGVSAWRFRGGESGARWAKITGRTIAEAHADYVLDHMWIEPMLYMVSPAPRIADIEPMLADPALVAAFEKASGEGVAALYAILHGAVGKFKTVQAAAVLCTAFYREHTAPTVLVTVRPDEFEDRAKIVREAPDLPPLARGAENPTEPGPESVAETSDLFS